MAKNKEKAGAGRTIVILLVVLLLLLTAGAYGYGVYYFSSHFLPGSMVNGFNCSYMASEDTEDLLNQRVGAYAVSYTHLDVYKRQGLDGSQDVL